MLNEGPNGDTSDPLLPMELYSWFMLFGNVNGTMNYIGRLSNARKRIIMNNFSVYDLIIGSNKTFTVDSGMLLVHLPEKPKHGKQEYSIRANLFISIAKEGL